MTEQTEGSVATPADIDPGLAPASVVLGARSIGARRGSRLVRLLNVLRAEDAVLIGWIGVIWPAMFGALGGAHASMPFKGVPDPQRGVLLLGALVLALVSLATRSRPGPFAGRPDADTHPAVLGAVLLGLVFVLSAAAHDLGNQNALAVSVFWMAVGVVAGRIAFARRLPVAPTQLRRALVVPLTMAAGALADGILAAALPVHPNGGGVAYQIALVLVAVPLFLILLLPFTAILYVVFIFPPRQVAEPEGTRRTWIVRFWAYHVAACIGIVAQFVLLG